MSPEAALGEKLRGLARRLFGRLQPLRIVIPETDDMLEHRRQIANQVLAGDGLEVGALNAPLPVPAAARVSYVDRMTVEQLRQHYPELAGVELAPVDIVDDGEQLQSFADASQDFVISNHFLEHTQDPIRTLQSQLRVLKVGGVLFLAVPLRHVTFDQRRPATSWAHVLRDHREGPAWSYQEHIREWVALVDRLEGEAAEEKARWLMEVDYAIHFHCWNEPEFLEFLQRCREELSMSLAVDYARAIDSEVLVILRRTG